MSIWKTKLMMIHQFCSIISVIRISYLITYNLKYISCVCVCLYYYHNYNIMLSLTHNVNICECVVHNKCKRRRRK